MNIISKLKKYRKNNPKKLFETFMTLTVASLVTMGAAVDSGLKEITVVRTDLFANTSESFTTKTRQENVHALFKEKGIKVDDNEILTFSMTDSLEDGNVLEIKQGRAVTLSADGVTKLTLTSQETVADALIEAGVEIQPYDWAEPSFEAPVTEGMYISLHRISVQEETVTEKIPSPVENLTDDNMFEDEKKVIKGSDGEKQVVYRILSDANGEVYREAISETILKEATPTTVTVGTKVKPKATKQGRTFSYKRKITVKATAYDTSLEENGGWTKTAMGLTPGYGIVAVDPRVIPLGTKLYIESPDDGQSWTYGYCIGGDTGGAIKGNRVDLCYNTQAECVRFGVRSATVYILD